MVIKLVEVTGVVRGLGSAWGGYVDYWGDLLGYVRLGWDRLG